MYCRSTPCSAAVCAMATNLANNKQNKMKRLESRKSHSWWWDSHISPKNKWLQENLEVMDGYVKRMLKLIEEDADSFAKKAEMYYKKRPELINLVEEFYRMYRALSERYDIVSGELRKRGPPSDLHSQSSGISDTSSDQNIEHRGSGHRAAGFDIFLGGGGNKLEQSNKEGDESLSSDSESESDDSLVLNNYAAIPSSDEEQGLLRKRINELEAEISQAKEKSRLLDEENSESVRAKFAEYEEKLNDSKEAINKLKDEVQKYKSPEYYNTSVKQEDSDHVEVDTENVGLRLDEDKENEIRMLENELRVTKEKLLASETDVENLKLSINHLQDQLGTAQNDVSVWKNKLEDEKNEVSDLQDRVLKCESSLSDRDQEIKKLGEAAISNANKTFNEENSRLQTDIDRLLNEKKYLEHNLKEMDLQSQSLTEEVNKLKDEKEETKTFLEAEIKKLNSDIDEKNNNIENLSRNLDAYETKITVYIAEIGEKNIKINEMNKHLHQLHMEHVELIVAAEGARKHMQELKSRITELEQETDKQQEVIQQGGEEKREAIRQLCLSLEYYRNGYHKFRQAIIEHKRLPVIAS